MTTDTIDTTLCIMCAYPATAADETGAYPLCASCKADEAVYIAERDHPIELSPEILAATDRARTRALDEAVARMRDDTIDVLLSFPNALSAAPQSTVLDIPLSPSVASASLEGSRQAPSWEIQTPNLRDRLNNAIAKARDAQSPILKREWAKEAFSLIERLVDASTVCSCGVALNALTGRCEACDERHEQLMADRARMGAMARDVDTECGF